MSYEIKTFLKTKRGFVPVEVALRPNNTDYVEGAIFWKIGEKTLISQAHWDLVDQLWAYIVSGLNALMKCGVYETYFPDQPLRLAFKARGEHSVEVQVGETKTTVDRCAFLNSLVDGAEEFFTRMLELIPEHDATWNGYLDNLEQIRRGTEN